MIRKEELQQLERLGKRLEKRKRVRDWKAYNMSLQSRSMEYTAQQREITQRDEKRDWEARREEFVDKAVYYNRTKKTYGI